jgi:hypothetical protein
LVLVPFILIDVPDETVIHSKLCSLFCAAPHGHISTQPSNAIIVRHFSPFEDFNWHSLFIELSLSA